jgi:hypothetical protein
MSKEHFSYSAVPSPKQFQKDSSVTFAVRRDDTILAHLDWLLEQYSSGPHHHLPTRRLVILCDLFLTANYWIKNYEGSSRMKKDRYPAVLALFEAVVNQMAQQLHCKICEVGQYVKEIFGRDMTDKGAQTDRDNNAHYFNKVEREMYRLKFKGGKVYNTDPEKHHPPRLGLLTSSDYSQDGLRRPGGSIPLPGAAPFVMTMEREFYLTRHYLNVPGHENIFHSAYTSGGIVAAAGTMLVNAGTIVGIRPDSGHYKPLENNIVGALTALGMFGVPLQQITVYGYAGVGDRLGSALDFMRSRLTWSEFMAARKDMRGIRQEKAEAEMKAAAIAARPPRPPRPYAPPPPLPPRNDLATAGGYEDKYQN